jgi:drug/metabolite transporter (DMT)-like permease
MDWSFVLVILLGAVPKLLKKKLLDKMTVTEYFILFSICMSILTFGYFLYKTYVEKEKIQLAKIFEPSILPIFAIVVLFAFISIQYKLGFFKRMQLSKYVPIFKSLSIVASIILGVVFLGEKKTMKDLAGSALIIGGVILLNGVKSGNSGSS